MAINLKNLQRAQRKTMITVAEWTGASHDVYTVQTTQPSDWATNYDSYYTKVGDTYEPVTGSEAPVWAANTYYTKTTTTQYREVLGTRTEESSIEYNPDVQKVTDILGTNWTDVEKTEPQQTFDPFYILGGSDLGEYLAVAAMKNDIDAYNNVFTIYVITSFIGEVGSYKAVKHKHSTILPTSLGGDAYVAMPLELHYSNDIEEGTVDKLGDDFVFTPAT